MTTAARPTRPHGSGSDAPYLAEDPADPTQPAGVGHDLGRVAQAYTQAISHFYFPSSRQREGTEECFLRHAAEWKEATQFDSSPTRAAMHSAYQSIVGMGEAAVPLILRELDREPAHWFWALRSITGIDPVKPSERGQLDLMAQAWLRWGRLAGYVW